MESENHPIEKEHRLPNLCVTCCFKLLVFGDLYVLDTDTKNSHNEHFSAPSRSDRIFSQKPESHFVKQSRL